MSTTHIFITGASGYVGGSVLHALLHSPNVSNYSISTLARPQQVERLETLGVRVVTGSLDDLDILRQEASEADIVLHTASSNHLPSAQALAAGLAKRKSGGKPAHLIHTSGTSIISDAANGEYLAETVYRDTDDIYALEKSDPSYLFRAVDVNLVEAGEKGSFGVSIVVPPRIYGSGTGLFKRNTNFVQFSVHPALKARQVHHVGAGLNVFSHVHIEDLSSLYVLLVDAASAGTAPSGKKGYFFAETGEHEWKELYDNIARVLHARGLVDNPESTPFASIQVAADALIFGSTQFLEKAFTCNSRSRAVRGRKALGWKPVHTSDDFLKTIEAQVNFVIEQDRLLE